LLRIHVGQTNTYEPGGGAFGVQYTWDSFTVSAVASSSSGVPYTEWIEVLLEQPVYIIRVNIGQPRCA
jgi:hypothetical protein